MSNSEYDELDTSQARAEILSRIRGLQGRALHLKDSEVRQAKAYMAQHAKGPTPEPVEDVLSLFVQKAKGMLSTVETLPSATQVVQAVERYLHNNSLQGAVSVWPTLESLDWSALGMPVAFGAPSGDDLIGISGVFAAVAETGTLVFASTPEEPASTHLLPETHIAIVKASQVFHTMEDVFEKRRQLGLQMPRAMNFVSGPSRTADIEQTIVLGAHGPYRVHVLILANE